MNHTCPVPGCGATFRSGSKAVVLTSAGDLSTRLVCPKCAARAVALVPPQLSEVPCAQCGKPATLCGSCSNDAAQKAAALIVKPFADHFRKQARAYDMAGDEPREPNKEQARAIRAGRVLGLLQAAEVIETLAPREVFKPGTLRTTVNGHTHERVIPEDDGDAFEVTPSPELVERLKRGEKVEGAPLFGLRLRAEELKSSAPVPRPIVPPSLEPKSARVLLAIMASRHHAGKAPASRRELGAFARYKIKGSTLRNGLGALRGAGLIEGAHELPSLTAAGIEAAAGLGEDDKHEAKPLDKGASVLLGIMAQRHTAGQRPATRRELSLFSGYKLKGSTLRNALGALRSMGYIDGPHEHPTITSGGLDVAGDTSTPGDEPSKSGPDLIEDWKRKLGGAPARILSALVSFLPNEPSREALAHEVGIDPDGSTYRNGVGRLRGYSLVSKDGLALAPELRAGWLTSAVPS